MEKSGKNPVLDTKLVLPEANPKLLLKNTKESKGGTQSLKLNKIIPVAQRKRLPSPQITPQLLIRPMIAHSDPIPITECKKPELQFQIFNDKTAAINPSTISDDGTHNN